MRTEFKMSMSGSNDIKLEEYYIKKPPIEVNLVGCRCKKRILIDLITYVNHIMAYRGKIGIDLNKKIKENCGAIPEFMLLHILEELDINIYNSYLKCMVGEPGFYFNKDIGYYNIVTNFADIVETNKYSSIWYIDNPVCIANIKDSNGSSIYIESAGEVKYILTVLDTGEEFELTRTKDFQSIFNSDSEILSALHDSHDKYSLEIHSNNWFEISIKDKYDNHINDCVCDADDIRVAVMEAYKLFVTQM